MAPFYLLGDITYDGSYSIIITAVAEVHIYN